MIDTFPTLALLIDVRQTSNGQGKENVHSRILHDYSPKQKLSLHKSKSVQYADDFPRSKPPGTTQKIRYLATYPLKSDKGMNKLMCPLLLFLCGRPSIDRAVLPAAVWKNWSFLPNTLRSYRSDSPRRDSQWPIPTLCRPSW